MSTDPAHSLADVFDLGLEDRPTPVAEGLEGQQVDAQARLEQHWSDIRDHLVALLDWAGLARVEAEELAVVPGLDEVFALADVKAHHESGRYDLLVVDCAPTAETLRLLSLPDALAWYMERVFPMGRRLVATVRPALSRLTAMPIADDGVMAAVARLWDGLAGVRDLLSDPRSASVRLVLNPEKMVIAEARRTFTYLCLFGYPVDAVVVNRLLPPEVADPYFRRWKEVQAAHLALAYEAFSPVPVLEVPLFDDEPIGAAALLRLADACYEDSDPAAVLFDGAPARIMEDGEDLVLDLRLPFVARDQLDLGRRDGELFVKVGPYRRVFSLPSSLERREVRGARFEDDRLRVSFR
jgi:arsenite-transporting ATPase